MSRIDHGVRSEEDPALLQRLARARVPLTVCPLSNVKLRVFASLADHNLKRLLQRGLCVTVNSDDPAYFGGYLADNYLAVQRSLGLSRADIVQLASNSIEASFLPADAKHHWLRKIRALAGGSYFVKKLSPTGLCSRISWRVSPWISCGKTSQLLVERT